MPATLLIKVTDNPGAADGRWLAGHIVGVHGDINDFGTAEKPATGNYYHFTVTDKTEVEVAHYLQKWNRLIDMNVIAGPDPQGFRRINVRNNLVNVSGTIGEWTVANTDAIILEWNTLYPTTNLVTVDIHQSTNPDDTWQCEGTFTTGQAQEFEEVIIEKGLADLLVRRVWFITPAGMANIQSAGGSQSGTAAQFGSIVRDGLLN